MGDFSTRRSIRPLFIHSFWTPYAGLDLRGVLAPSMGAITWVSDVIVYVPFFIPFSYPVSRLYWVNGSTITSSNADVGIYTADGTRIVSAGTTALSGTSTSQYATLSTQLTLSPGRYYFGYVCDNTTSRSFGTASWTANNLRLAGCLQETAASALLPAIMTPVAVANAIYPLCGMTSTTSGF